MDITNTEVTSNLILQYSNTAPPPTSANHLVPKDYVDNNFYPDTTPLNSITAPTASVSMNSQLITNLADATSATDALNRQTADARYYSNTTTLNNITAPSGSVSLNS